MTRIDPRGVSNAADPGVVIVGAGHAGLQVASALREEGFPGRIQLVGDEPGLPYQRPPLSKAFLDGEADHEAILLRASDYFDRERIELVSGRAVAIDRASRTLGLQNGAALRYDHLVLATGARERALALPGAELDGVVTLRTRADAEALRTRLASVKRAVVIGAGFIGLEFAAVASARGIDVHVLEKLGRPLSRAVSEPISSYVLARHRQAGVEFSFHACVDRLVGANGRIVAVQLTDGRLLPADLVLVGIGVVPNDELARDAGLEVGNGIVVDECLRTSDPAISAIGDCASFPTRHGPARVRLESVQNATDQARTVASRLTGRAVPFTAVPWFWSEQGALRLQIAGLTGGHDAAVLRGHPDDGSFSIFCYRGPKLLGVETVNRPAEHMVCRRLIAAGVSLTPAQAADAGFNLKAHLGASRAAPAMA